MIGAAIGSLIKNKPGSFTAGIVSHVLADLLPHRDFNPAVEVPLMAGTMAAIAGLHGVDSPEFLGALGAIAPDTEHALSITGFITNEQKVFPTHMDDGKYHGTDSGEHLSQTLVALIAACIIAACSDNSTSGK